MTDTDLHHPPNDIYSGTAVLLSLAPKRPVLSPMRPRAWLAGAGARDGAVGAREAEGRQRGIPVLKHARLCSVGFVDSGKWYESLTELPEVSGTGMEVLQNSQKFREGTENAVPAPRVLWHGKYRTHRSSRYGYERHTNSQKFRVRV